MTPQQFIAKWGTPGGVAGPAHALNEEQGAQSHFLDLCELLGVPKPGSADGYLFEEKNAIIGGKTGYADVFLRGHFAWENKAPGKNLDTALKQLLNYSLALSNPPLLVVCDRLTLRIHTQFNGHPSEVHTVLLGELDQPEKQALLRHLWTNPERFRPKKTSRDITEAAAKSFATLAEGLRRRSSAPQADLAQMPGPLNASFLTTSAPSPPATPDYVANRVAHFLTQCLFCFFAEDVGLLPGRMFEGLVNNRNLTSDKLTLGLTNLFKVMGKGGLYGIDDIPWFNGGLFKRIDVPELSILEVTELRNAAALNWSAIDVSIFGTLFERGLDPSKRSQLGAHYTDPATILRIIEPVLSRPLLQKWELVAHDLRVLLSKSTKKGDKNYKVGKAKFVQWLEDLKSYRLLDPACGSGNFLFMGLKALKDIEHKSHLDAAACGLDREADLVTGPHNVLGIELNEYAAELARVTVWIGELQWRMAHGYEFKTNPVLEPLEHIECRDALLSFPSDCNSVAKYEEARVEPGARAAQMPSPLNASFLKTSAPPTPLDDVGVTEASWPKANVVIGNPPFLGGSKKRRELGDDYFAALDGVFAGRVPGGADLVCYWFDKARVAIESHGLEAAGLVTTNSIRGGANRKVLDAISQSSRIFEAWSDEGWVNDGAAVRVSLVCFGHADGARLDGVPVDSINSNLSATALNAVATDLTKAQRLPSNKNACFLGPEKNGKFDITGQLARQWLLSPNVNGLSSSLILKPRYNGIDLQRRYADGWVIDFGTTMSESDAAGFEMPFDWVTLHVKPIRATNVDKSRRINWWRFGRTGDDFRVASQGLSRYLAMSAHTRHVVFSWLDRSVIPDKALVAITRQDDLYFGLVNSRFHQLWSLGLCTWLGVGNDARYNAGNCFETFPFPAGLTPADTAHQRTELLPDGSIIPADIYEQNNPLVHIQQAQAATNSIVKSNLNPTTSEVGLARMSGTASNGEAYEAPASEPTPPCESQLKSTATAIAQAAKRLNDLRENWLNPPEWTHKVPEVIPLGMDKSPYPDRIEPKPGINEADLKALQKRTLTNLYNAKPAWLQMAHQQLDLAVARAYGWADYTAAMPDDELLKRLLALNLARSATISTGNNPPQTP